MKTDTKNQYHFDQPSPSNQPGFEIFKAGSNHNWFFHGNEVDGTPALFSPAFDSAEKAKRALDSVFNAIKQNRTRFEESSEGWQFVVKAGNNQELARSRIFPDKMAGEKSARYFQKVVSSPRPMVSPKESGVPAPATIQETGVPEEGTEGPSRYAFRLFFYPAAKGEPLTGRIENIGTQEKVIFKGLDGQSILDFLRVQINEPHQDSLPLPQTRESVSPVPATISVEGGPSIHIGNPLEIDVKAQGLSGATIFKECSVALRNMDSQQITTLYNSACQVVTGDRVLLKFDTKPLVKGTYHFSLSVRYQNSGNSDSTSTKKIDGTGWFLLV